MRCGRRAATAAACAAIALVISGCATTDDSQPMKYDSETVSNLASSLRSSGSESQALALDDGVVNAEEYQALFEELRGCIEGKGYGLEGPYTSPLTGVTLEFAYRDNGRAQDVAMPDYEKCETAYWLPAASVYSATAPQRMDGAFKAGLIKCMSDADESASTDAITFTELVGSNASSARIETASDCAREVAFLQNPELISLSIVI